MEAKCPEAEKNTLLTEVRQATKSRRYKQVPKTEGEEHPHAEKENPEKPSELKTTD